MKGGAIPAVMPTAFTDGRWLVLRVAAESHHPPTRNLADHAVTVARPNHSHQDLMSIEQYPFESRGVN